MLAKVHVSHSLFINDAALICSGICICDGRETRNSGNTVCLSDNFDPASVKWMGSPSQLLGSNVAPPSSTAVPDVGKGKCLEKYASLSLFLAAMPHLLAPKCGYATRGKQRTAGSLFVSAIISTQRAENGWDPSHPPSLPLSAFIPAGKRTVPEKVAVRQTLNEGMPETGSLVPLRFVSVSFRHFLDD